MASANALYVLRLVLGRGYPRHFSTAVWAQQSAPATHRNAALSSSISTAVPPVDDDFLEPESEDYDGAAAFLPARQPSQSAPIPWPTLFPHGNSDLQRQRHARACDLVARLVAENRLEPARKVYKVLRALHTEVLHREIYLSAAINSLNTSPEGRADFLFWLQLVPNRPAMNSNPKSRATWEPVVHRLLESHLDNVQFIADFLIIAAQKGLCPTVLPLLILPLAAVAKPDASERIFEAAVTTYVGYAASSTSRSPRAELLRGIAETQRTRWWNRYLRSLALVGWNDSARALLFSPPEGVVWSQFTRAMALGEGLDIKKRKGIARAKRAEAEKADPLSLLLDSPEPEAVTLSARLRRALTPFELPSTSAVADLQRDLLELGREDLLNRFKRRFCHPPSEYEARRVPWAYETRWNQATIKRLSDAGDHASAVQAFREHFLWVGLPPFEAAPETPLRYNRSRRIPDISIITTVLPSLLEIIPANDLERYHKSYLRQSLPPALLPNEWTHLAFVRHLSHRLGSEAATKVIQTIAVAGFDPGEPAWNALLLKLNGTGQVDATLAVLNGMEKHAKLSENVYMPQPSARTYAGLIRLCIRHDKAEQAKNVLERFRAWIGDQQVPEAVEDVNRFKTVEGEVTALQKGNPRRTPSEAQPYRTKTRALKRERKKAAAAERAAARKAADRKVAAEKAEADTSATVSISAAETTENETRAVG